MAVAAAVAVAIWLRGGALAHGGHAACDGGLVQLNTPVAGSSRWPRFDGISEPNQGQNRECKAHQNGHRFLFGWLGQHPPAARHRHSLNLWRIGGTLEAFFSRVSDSLAPPP